VSTRHGYRFLVEVLYLAGLAAALAFSDVGAYAIVGAMAAGWLLVVGIEWAAFRSVPHFAAGEPPRWRVPRVELPPPRPLEQLTPAYPGSQRDEAVTWIAPAELRAELLGEWPVATVPEDTQEAPPEEWLVPLPEPEPELPEPGSPEANQVREGPGSLETVSARSAETVSEVSEPEPELPEPGSPEANQVREVHGIPAPAAPRLARHHLDPLAEPQRRRFRRRGLDSTFVEVPARPVGPRPLPGAARRGEDEQ